MAWYKVGTINVTNNSATVTGVGTAWVGAVLRGEGVVMPNGVIYEIDLVNSATGITLSRPYTGPTASGQTYSICPIQDYLKVLASQAAELINGMSTIAGGEFGVGSVGLPSIRTAADPNTGLNLLGGDELSLVTAGVDRFKIGPTGTPSGTASDYLRSRANHTGTQLASTIIDFASAALIEMRKYGIGAVTGPTVTDIDALRTGGMFVANAAASAAAGLPLSTLNHTIIHASGSSGSAMQFASPVTTGAGNRWRLWHRQMVADGWAAWSEFAFTGAANTWTAQQTFQDTGNQPLRVMSSTSNECGLVKPATLGGGLAIQGKTSGTQAFIDLEGEADKGLVIRLGRGTNVGASNVSQLAGYASDGSGTNNFLVNLKTGAIKGKGVYDTTTTGTPNVYVDSAGNLLRSSSNATIYEEGTFTPTIEGLTTAGAATYSYQSGTYTRTGDRVHINLRITLTAFSGASGVIRIGGLPFAVSTPSTNGGAATIGLFSGLAAITNFAGLTASFAYGTSKIAMYKTIVGATGIANLDSSEIGQAFSIYMSGTYKV